MAKKEIKIWTYIIHTMGNEFYCSTTTNIDKTLEKHLHEKKGWFALVKTRKQFHKIYTFNGDIEQRIKSFGIQRFIETMHSPKMIQEYNTGGEL